ncbi:alpha/beta fold hydrolase [Micromonospora endolithica]|uniref:Alpha/beta fold hydrolase n=1 Tax=Micromonospora endolithica TaxID=230091 RepID=A0A3A9ZSG7_9ACTN|nr:alpha/beta fold hydrolase [Micromonospora endolithica]
MHRRPGHGARTLLMLVHGLGGRRYSTWGRTPEFLFEDLVDVDIGLSDYSSGLRRWRRAASVDLARHAENLADTIRDLPYERFVLIGHSMGGLLCQAAVKDLLDSRVRDANGALVVERVAAVFLMATPQAGVRVPTPLARLTRDGRVLRVHSRFVTELQRRFNDQLTTDPARSDGFERILLPVYAATASADRWVDDLSARLGIPRQRIKTARGTHTSIIKPASRHDDVYQWLLGRILASLEPPALATVLSRSRPGHTSVLTAWRRYAIVDDDRLFGVKDKIATMVEAVDDSAGSWAVSIFGGGGIGKTALAFEVAKECVRRTSFSRVAWASAMNAAPSTHSDASEPATAYWRDVVRTIARQLDLRVHHDDLSAEELAERLSALPSGERLLTIVDNLESVEDATSAVQRLHEMGLGRPHKILVTTRWPLLTENSSLVTSFEATNLDFDSTMALIHYLGRGDSDLRAADTSKLESVYSVSRGNPFLVKLIIREYLTTHRSLDRVIHDLKQFSGEENRRTLGEQVYTTLYLRSVDALRRLCGSTNADLLMAAFISHESGHSFSQDDLARLSGLGSTAEFQYTLRAACQLSLVRAFDFKQRYAIHSLLYDFLLLILAGGKPY